MTEIVSKTRTVVLPEYCGATPGLQWPLVWPPKDPFDTNMDFSLDVSGWLTDIGDTIGSFVVGSAPTGDVGDLIITRAFSQNGICTVITDGGVPFDMYTVTYTITSAIQGEVLSRSILLPVEPRYGNTIASASISGVVQ